jgi:hypothetical protein
MVTGKCFIGPESLTTHHLFSRFTSRFISIGLLGSLIQQVRKKNNRRDSTMNFNQLADETFVKAWVRCHDLMTDLPTASMEDLEFSRGFYCGLSQEAKEHIDTLAGGTFFMLNAKEHFDSRTDEIDPLTRKFQGMALTQLIASETHQA